MIPLDKKANSNKPLGRNFEVRLPQTGAVAAETKEFKPMIMPIQIIVSYVL